MCQVRSHFHVSFAEQFACFSIFQTYRAGFTWHEIRHDWWVTFLPLFNGVSLIKLDVWSFDDFQFATDACLTGGGATWQDQCFSVVFPLNIVKEAVHITALEFFVELFVVVRAWVPLLAHHRFIVSCDNDATVTVINSGITRDPFMQHCLCQLWFTASVYDFEIRASFVPGDHKLLPDAFKQMASPLEASSWF